MNGDPAPVKKQDEMQDKICIAIKNLVEMRDIVKHLKLDLYDGTKIELNISNLFREI